jgi:uncharacterized membrane protein
MKKYLHLFFQGLLLIGPISLTVYILFRVFVFLDTIIPFHELLPFHIPGLGLIVIVLLVTLFGYIGTLYVANPFLAFIERAIDRAPLVKLIYTSIKDLVAAFVGEKKRFNHPVLITVSKENNIHRIGFITQNDLSHLGLGAEKVAVYIPFSYSFSGQLLIVSKENISPIDSSGTEMMKFVISGGVTEL